MSNNVVALRKDPPSAEPVSESEIYLKIFEHSKDSVFLIDSERGGILFANPRATEDTSYEAAELKGLDFKSLFLPEEQAAIGTLLETTLQWNVGVDPQRFLKRKTGRKIIVEISSSVVVFEGHKTIFCSVRDITARIKAEEKIKQYSKELETINAELEDRVKARTQELAAVNDKLSETNSLITRQKKELDDVMSNIKQAIFTVSRELKVNPEHSKFVGEVFGAKPAGNSPVAEFLYEPDQQEKLGRGTMESLTLAFEMPETWDMVKGVLPAELKYHRPGQDGSHAYRDLRIEWVPIYDESAMSKIMVVCLDVTEQKRLEAEIAEKEAQHNEQLEFISHLISMPGEIVAQFVQDSKRMVEETKSLLEKGSASNPDTLKGLMRTMHTIKGSARQFKLNSVQKRAHEIESRIAPVMENPSRAPADFLSSVAQEFAPIEVSLTDVNAFYEKTVHGHGDHAPVGDTVSIPVSKIETLMQTALPEDGRVSSEAIRQAFHWLIQVPVRGLFDRLESLTQSLSTELQREIRIERSGDAFEMDFRYGAPLYDAFLHAIRNSVDHGCETPEERSEAGKPSGLTIRMTAEAVGNNLVFQFGDDGRGVDVDKVKARALEKGLATEQELKSCSKEQIIQYIFMAGFSTKDTTTLLSGRGVGLDVVKEVVERTLDGEVIMYSEPGKGTRLVARLPARALSKSKHSSFLCLPGLPTPGKCDRQSLRTATNLDFRELTASSSPGETAIAVSDLAGAHRLRTELGFSPQRIVCFDSMEPKPMVEAFHREGLRHFVDSGSAQSPHYLKTCLRNITAKTDWGLESLLWPGTEVHACSVTDYARKNEICTQVTDHFGKLKSFSGFPEIMGTVADEMLMNGMFDAPRDENGKEKYNHLPRTHHLVLQPNEAVTLRYGADPHFAVISIEDPFGALSYPVLINYLKKCYAAGADQIDRKQGGAGLGLYTIFESCHSLMVRVVPGVKTEIIVLISRTRSFERYQRMQKSLSYLSK